MAGSTHRPPLVLGLALALWPPGLVEAAAGPGRPPSVLFVDPGDGGRPQFPELVAGFRERLRDAADLAPVTVYTVSMDVTSLSSDAAREALDTLVRERYGAVPLGVIVAFREPTFAKAFGWRDRLWPDTPVLAVVDDDEDDARARARGRPGDTVLRLDMRGDSTVRIALALLPDTRRIVFVGGREFFDPPGTDRLEWLTGRGPEVERLVGLPMPELLDRVSRLPERSFILFGGLNTDGTGRHFASRDGLDLVAGRTSVPVFVNVSTFVGRGVVGGNVVDFADVGRAAAGAVLGYLRGAPPPPALTVNATRPVFDGRELDRWGIDLAAVPAGATVLFRRPTMWEEHRGKVLAGLLIGLLQTVVIGMLLLNRRRRREAEDGLRRLSARLMTAQEDERRRIARDLHDAVCQRLVLMAVDLDLLQGGLAEGAGPARGAGERTAEEIAEAARALSADVQRIAYQLHPASLDRLGLVHAVQRLAREVTTRSGVRIDTAVEDWPERELPPDVTLALYRVVQEGLHNVVRHSGAAQAHVSLRGGRNGLRVGLEDDGRGFDPTLVKETGLGLIGMRERLQLHGGRLTVASAPGRGTVVEAWVPAAALVAAAAPVAAAERPAGERAPA